MSIPLFGEIFRVILSTPTFVLLLELGLLLSVLILVFYKSGRQRFNRKKLSFAEEEAVIANYIPEELVGEIEDESKLNCRTVNGKVGKHINVEGKVCLNLATHNFLGLLEDQGILENAIKSIQKYGVGSCGPRGFYGTIDVHLDLEEKLAKFMNVEESIVYSYGFSTMASAIPAYSKKNDMIFADEKVNFAVQKGLDASRSKIHFFKHNDLADLERLLQENNNQENPKQRKFIVVEGIYVNTGEMCALPEIVALRKKYKCRLFLDESVSFGTMGKTGRGLTEFFNVDTKDVDLICGSLEWAIPSVGGFCVGSHFVMEHQRLSGLGYCFSASLPPLLTQAAISALDIFENNPEIFTSLQTVCKKAHKELQALSKFKLSGHELSPVKHLLLANDSMTAQEKRLVLGQIVEKCISNNVAVIDAKYLQELEKGNPEPSLRISVNKNLTDEDIKSITETLRTVSEKVC